MGKFFITLALIGYLIKEAYPQDTSLVEQKSRSGIVIKSTPIPFLFETAIAGKLAVSQHQLKFTSDPCRAKDKRLQAVFPCNNYLIKSIILPFDSIAQVRRRNYLFLFPNRLLVKLKNGDSYLFFAYRRKRIITAYKRHKVQQVSLLHD